MKRNAMEKARWAGFDQVKVPADTPDGFELKVCYVGIYYHVSFKGVTPVFWKCLNIGLILFLEIMFLWALTAGGTGNYYGYVGLFSMISLIFSLFLLVGGVLLMGTKPYLLIPEYRETRNVIFYSSFLLNMTLGATVLSYVYYLLVNSGAADIQDCRSLSGYFFSFGASVFMTFLHRKKHYEVISNDRVDFQTRTLL